MHRTRHQHEVAGANPMSLRLIDRKIRQVVQNVKKVAIAGQRSPDPRLKRRVIDEEPGSRTRRRHLIGADEPAAFERAAQFLEDRLCRLRLNVVMSNEIDGEHCWRDHTRYTYVLPGSRSESG